MTTAGSVHVELDGSRGIALGQTADWSRETSRVPGQTSTMMPSVHFDCRLERPGRHRQRRDARVRPLVRGSGQGEAQRHALSIAAFSSLPARSVYRAATFSNAGRKQGLGAALLVPYSTKAA